MWISHRVEGMCEGGTEVDRGSINACQKSISSRILSNGTETISQKGPHVHARIMLSSTTVKSEVESNDPEEHRALWLMKIYGIAREEMNDIHAYTIWHRPILTWEKFSKLLTLKYLRTDMYAADWDGRIPPLLVIAFSSSLRDRASQWLRHFSHTWFDISCRRDPQNIGTVGMILWLNSENTCRAMTMVKTEGHGRCPWNGYGR